MSGIITVVSTVVSDGRLPSVRPFPDYKSEEIGEGPGILFHIVTES